MADQLPTLNKWQAEIATLQNKAFSSADSQLKKAYKYSYQSLLDELKSTLEKYDGMTFSQKMAFEKKSVIAKSLEDIIAGGSGDVEKIMNKYFNKSAEYGYSGSMYELEQSYGVALTNTIIDKRFVEEWVKHPVDGMLLSTRLYRQRATQAMRSAQALLDGLWHGQSYSFMATRLKEISEANYRQAMRILRTEGGRIQSEAKLSAYKEATEQGVHVKKKWLAIKDGRTRHDHMALDGQVVDIDDTFSIYGYHAEAPRLFGVAGQDINCRCVMVTVVDELDAKQIGHEVQKTGFLDWKRAKIKELNLNTDFSVRSDILNSPEYVGSFKKFGFSNSTANKLAKASRDTITASKEFGTPGVEFDRAIINANGKMKVIELSSGHYKQALNPDFSKLSADNINIYVHNHPGSSSFSELDLGTFATNEALDSIVASGHDGTIYVIQRNGGVVLHSRTAFNNEYGGVLREFGISTIKNADQINKVSALVSRKLGWKYGVQTWYS